MSLQPRPVQPTARPLAQSRLRGPHLAVSIYMYCILKQQAHSDNDASELDILEKFCDNSKDEFGVFRLFS